MGKMKDLFLAIEIAIETQDYKQLLKELESVSDEHRAQMLLDVVTSLAKWQERKEEKEELDRCRLGCVCSPEERAENGEA